MHSLLRTMKTKGVMSLHEGKMADLAEEKKQYKAFYFGESGQRENSQIT